MPKYSYSCRECSHSFVAFHDIKTLLKKCPQCSEDDALEREINKVYIKKQKEKASNNHIGNLTKQFIEENKTVLKELKDEIRENEYDDENISD